MDNVHFSSKSDHWATPPDVFAQLHTEFDFTLDPCALSYNAVCQKYFTPTQDGLKQSWAGERVFMNPPYGRSIGKWVSKAYEEWMTNNTLVVALLPSRTDTRWFHDCCTSGEIRFLRGRLSFENCLLPSWREDGNFKKSPAPFPSMIVVFRPRTLA